MQVVSDVHRRALYFSRSPIPGLKASPSTSTAVARATATVGAQRHLGMYAFRADFLATYVSLPDNHLQKTEDLEQLKVKYLKQSTIKLIGRLFIHFSDAT